MKKKPNGNWGIVATHKADPEIQWATGFFGSSQAQIFALALALTAGRSNPARFAWQPAAEVWP